MSKRILSYLVLLLIAFMVAFFVHSSVVDSNAYPYSLLNIYFFHVIAATIVYFLIEGVFLLAPNKAGYLYLAAIFIKIGFFVLLFKDSVMLNDLSTKSAKVSLIVPLFLFLVIEAFGVSKVLNSK